MAKRRKKENEAKNSHRRQVIEGRLEKKAAELNKHYPESKYEVQGMNVVRVSGRRPHKKSKKGAK